MVKHMHHAINPGKHPGCSVGLSSFSFFQPYRTRSQSIQHATTRNAIAKIILRMKYLRFLAQDEPGPKVIMLYLRKVLVFRTKANPEPWRWFPLDKSTREAAMAAFSKATIVASTVSRSRVELTA